MTGLTYRSRDDERDDRRQQEQLLAALDAAPSQLRRDEAGWWVIGGRHGAITTWGDGRSWMAHVVCRSARQWTITKRRLRFMTVTQDGDEEGCFRLFALPTAAQAKVVRDVLGLKKRRQYDPETLDQLRTTARGLVRARRVADQRCFDRREERGDSVQIEGFPVKQLRGGPGPSFIARISRQCPRSFPVGL